MAEAELSQIELKTTLLGWRCFKYYKVLLLGWSQVCLLTHLASNCPSEYWLLLWRVLREEVLTRLAQLHYLSLRNGVLRALALFT